MLNFFYSVETVTSSKFHLCYLKKYKEDKKSMRLKGQIPKKIPQGALGSSHRELLNAASLVSMRPFVREL